MRGGGRYHFAFSNGELTVGPPSSRRVDCHVSADPAALLPVIWGRRSQWPAIARGRLAAWGRKPWLGFRLSSLVGQI